MLKWKKEGKGHWAIDPYRENDEMYLAVAGGILLFRIGCAILGLLLYIPISIARARREAYRTEQLNREIRGEPSDGWLPYAWYENDPRQGMY
jgi:hypothetical protein